MYMRNYKFIMKGIEKRKHEHLIGCLEELRLHTTDPDQAKEVEAEIVTLTGIYERYISFIQGVESQADRYSSLYRDIQLTTYKELRKARRKQKNK